ncbi:MAG: signal peptidase [Frankiaceae bacterium]|nr:signal peptidase [Frankiaceae bacterium]
MCDMQATRGTAVAAPPDRPASRRTVLLVVTALVVLVADAVSKIIIVATLRPEERVHLFGNWLQLTETRNAGAAFSVGTGATFIFTGVAVAVVVVIARQARRLFSRAWALTLGLLLGGALGNLADRLLRGPAPLRGHVVDWIQLPHWPVFNLADSAIVVGGCLAVLLASRGVPLDDRPEPGGQP